MSDGGELSGYELEQSPVDGCGVEPDKCTRSQRSSLDSIAASRAFSFSSCSFSFLICRIFCSSAYRCTFLSIVGCQLSFTRFGGQLSGDNRWIKHPT